MASSTVDSVSGPQIACDTSIAMFFDEIGTYLREAELSFCNSQDARSDICILTLCAIDNTFCFTEKMLKIGKYFSSGKRSGRHITIILYEHLRLLNKRAIVLRYFSLLCIVHGRYHRPFRYVLAPDHRTRYCHRDISNRAIIFFIGSKRRDFSYSTLDNFLCKWLPYQHPWLSKQSTAHAWCVWAGIYRWREFKPYFLVNFSFVILLVIQSCVDRIRWVGQNEKIRIFFHQAPSEGKGGMAICDQRNRSWVCGMGSNGTIYSPRKFLSKGIYRDREQDLPHSISAGLPSRKNPRYLFFSLGVKNYGDVFFFFIFMSFRIGQRKSSRLWDILFTRIFPLPRKTS